MLWKLDAANGATLWSKVLGNVEGEPTLLDVAVDDDNCVYFAGYFNGTVEFGMTTDGEMISLTSDAV